MKMDWGKIFEKKEVKILAVVLAIALFLIFVKHLSFGIEFVGGVRIPIMLSQPVTATTMSQIISTIQSRINEYGLSQANVYSVGDQEVIVEIPQAGPDAVKNIETILQEQGNFEAIIDGQVALRGNDVIAVGGANQESTPSTTGSNQWSLGFMVGSAGAQQFAKAAYGKVNYPVYLFLDRPSKAVIIEDKNTFNPTPTILNALKKQGDDIQLFYSQDLLNETSSFLSSNFSTVILSKTAPSDVLAFLEQNNYSTVINASKRIVLVNDSEMLPVVDSQGDLEQWPAIGLLSAPLLSAGVTNGYPSNLYQISGTAVGATRQQQEAYAENQIKILKSVIGGGKLPVNTLVESSYSISPSLGSQFLTYSLAALILAIIVVSLIIVARYRKPVLIIPIILTNLFEIIILISILGTFGTISISAMAGVIALIGSGVDNQIVITDELLKGSKEQKIEEAKNYKEKLAKAFFIVFTTAGVAIAGMLPLLVSGIVQITGFALATILGVIIGVLVTRPAYGILVETLVVE
jgi:preprotein translocase subunit SecD